VTNAAHFSAVVISWNQLRAPLVDVKGGWRKSAAGSRGEGRVRHSRSRPSRLRQGWILTFVGGRGAVLVPVPIGPMYDVAITRLSYHLSFC
jgi:hypothetical protein